MRINNNSITRLVYNNSQAIISPMETFADRLQKLMDEHGDKQKTLAAKIKVSQGLIGHYLKGRHEPRKKILQRIADLYGINIIDLQYGKKRDKALPFSQNVQYVPLLQWESIDDFIVFGLKSQVLSEKPPKMIPALVDYKLTKGKSFALTVMGDAMMPDKKEGDIVIVDLMRSPVARETILYRFKHNKKEYHLRQFFQEGSAYSLRAINPNKEEYPTIPVTPDIEIMGVVVGTFKKG